MSTQLEKLTNVIAGALQDIGIYETSLEEDESIAKALLEAGVSITDRDTPSVLRSPCCGETVFIKNGWDGGDASAECHCGSEWDEGGEPTYWLSKVCTFDSVRKPV